MSASYWSSSHRNQWQFTREELTQARSATLQLDARLAGSNNGNNSNMKMSNNPNNSTNVNNTIRYDVNMRIYLHRLIVKLGGKLGLRQIILSTAEVYMTRFLISVPIREINIYLLATTCVYVACKIEENPQHIRTILSESRNLWPEFIPNDLTKLAEFEFYLIEEMDCYLVVHHPYNSLIDLIQVLKEGGNGSGMAGNNNNNGNNGDGGMRVDISPEEFQTCWSIINDSYVTDLHILFPPHVIAVGSLYLTLVLGADPSLLTLLGNPTTSGTNSSSSASTPHGNSLLIRKFEGLSNYANMLGSPGHGMVGGNLGLQYSRIENFIKFLACSNIDLDEVVETVQEMLTLYEGWNSYEEIVIRNGVHHMLLGLK